MSIHGSASRWARPASGARFVRTMLAAVIALSLLIGGCAAAPKAPAMPPQPSAPPAATPQPPTPPASTDPIANMAAFARLLGYIQYFHPSDAVAATDWGEFAILNIESVADAASPAELAARLGALFGPYAPTARVFVTGQAPPPAPAELRPRQATEPISLTIWVRSPYRLGPNQRGDIRPGLRIMAPLVDGHVPATATLALTELMPSNHNAGAIESSPGDPVVTIDLPAPDAAAPIELGGGLSAIIPLSLFADDGGTLPHAAIPKLAAAGKTPRGRHLAAVASAWNLFEHFFPYWDEVKVDWHQSLRQGLRLAAETDDEQSFARGFREMMAATGDAHLFLSHPDDKYNRPRDNPWASLGRGALPFEWDVVEGALVVTSIQSAAGSLRPGDRVIAIDGVASEAVIAEQLMGIGPKSEYGTWQALINMRRGSVASEVALAIQPFDGGSAYTATVARISEPDSAISLAASVNRLPAVASLGQGVVYVDAGLLATADLSATLPLLAQATGIVIDSRGYPTDYLAAIRLYGHLTAAPLHIAPFMLPVITRPDDPLRQAIDLSQGFTFIEPLEPRFTANLAFVINGGAVSRAEHFLGIAEGYGLGDFVGEPTAGINGDIVLQTLPSHYAISWTGMRVTKFDGSPLFGVGITPTIPAHRTIAGVAAGRDELLERAFEAVSGQPATAMKVEPASKR